MQVCRFVHACAHHRAHVASELRDLLDRQQAELRVTQHQLQLHQDMQAKDMHALQAQAQQRMHAQHAQAQAQQAGAHAAAAAAAMTASMLSGGSSRMSMGQMAEQAAMPGNQSAGERGCA